MAQPLDVARLRRALLLYATAGAFIVAVVSAALTYLPLADRLRQTAVEGVLDAARASAYPIAEIVAGRRKIARQVSGRIDAQRLLEDYNAGRLPPEAFVRDTALILHDAMTDTDDITGLTRIAADGVTIASVGESYDPALWPTKWRNIDTITPRGPL